MIAILAYWIFLFILLLPGGILLKQLLKLKTDNSYLLLILGMFYHAIGFTVSAFFFPLGFDTLLFFLAGNIAVIIAYRKEVLLVLNKTYFEFKALAPFLKIILLLLFLGALLKSAQLPFVIDNESYYVQTIKWLNQYGFVKGLGNLHIFFAQTSAWHVLQAGLNLSFFTDRINDINGFLFIVATSYYITEAEKYRSKQLYWLGLLPLFSILLFLFIDAPSPDLPVVMITPILLHLFLQKENETENFKIAALLFIFLVFIKITIAPLGLIFIYHFAKRNNIAFFAAVGIFTATLWIAKNIIISGYPLYPFEFFKTGYDWTVPPEMLQFISETTANHGYYKGAKVPQNSTIVTKLIHWIKLGGIAGLLNKLAIVLFLLMPLFNKIRHNKKYRIIYSAMLIHFIILLFTSPQFRFFIQEILFFSVFIMAEFFNYFKLRFTWYKLALACGIAIAFGVFLNISTAKLTDNKFHQSVSNVQLSHLYLPEPVSKYDFVSFEKNITGNLEYYSPQTNFFFYGTANGPLPCVNKVQLQWFEKKFGIVPQLRKGNIKDGFYAHEITGDNK